MENSNSNSEVTKRVIERSASYPNISIERAIEFVGDISKNFTASQIINREDIAAVLNTSPNYISRDVAACVQYTFFTKHKEGYQITPLFKSISNPLSEKEKRKLLIETFAAPKLYSELISKFDGHVVPTELRIHLIRFHKITENAAPDAADLFITNARFVGVLSENNILNVKELLNRYTNDNIQIAEIISEETQIKGNDNNIVDLIESPNAKSKETILISESTNEEKIRIPLSGKRYAYLSYPSDLTKKDIEILNKQIELLQLIVE